MQAVPNIVDWTLLIPTHKRKVANIFLFFLPVSHLLYFHSYFFHHYLCFFSFFTFALFLHIFLLFFISLFFTFFLFFFFCPFLFFIQWVQFHVLFSFLLLLCPFYWVIPKLIHSVSPHRKYLQFLILILNTIIPFSLFDVFLFYPSKSVKNHMSNHFSKKNVFEQI